MDTKTALKIALEIDHSDIRSDARDILSAYNGKDFIVELGRKEYRIIHDDVIDDIFDSQLRELVDECYDIEEIKEKMGNVGRYFTFDYDSFVDDCRIDGYGHHFASYNGEEIEVSNWHIFRVS